MTNPEFRPIVCEGILYRGSNLQQPEEVWNYPRGCWSPYSQGDLSAAAWIDETSAEPLKTNNPSAEHYCYYDTPPWSQGGSPASRAYPAKPGKVAYKIFEYDGALFRMPASRDVLIVDEVFLAGKWAPYTGVRSKPAMFGDFLGVEEVNAPPAGPRKRDAEN
jgi:hypothetical protein